MRSTWLRLLLLAPFVCAPVARGQIRLDATERPLTALVDELAAASGRTILAVGDDVDAPTSVALYDLPWPDALEALAVVSGRRVRALGEALLLEAPARVTIQFTEASLATVLELCRAYTDRGALVTDDLQGVVTLDLKEVAGDEALAVLRAVARDLHVTRVGDQLVLSGAPLDIEPRELLRELALPSGGNPQGRARCLATTAGEAAATISVVAGVLVVPDPALRLPRPLRLNDLPWRDALQVLALACDARLVLRAGRAHLVPRPSAALHARAAPLGPVLEALAAVTGVVARADDPTRQVTGALRGCAPDEAVVALAAATRCAPAREAEGWRLRAKPLVAPPRPAHHADGPGYDPDRPPRRDEVFEVFGGDAPRVTASVVVGDAAAAVIDGAVVRRGEALPGRPGVRVIDVGRGAVSFDANGRRVLRELEQR